MRIIKNLLLFIPLFVFLASCQGPYHKDKKEPIKIGLQEIASADKEEGDAEEGESIIDLPSLDNKGVGPIDHVELDDEIDQDMAAAGKETLDRKSTRLNSSHVAIS